MVKINGKDFISLAHTFFAIFSSRWVYNIVCFDNKKEEKRLDFLFDRNHI